MKEIRFKIPDKGGAGRKLATRIRDGNQPCAIPDRHMASDSWVVTKSGGGPLVILRSDFDEFRQEFGISWAALPLWISAGRIGEHSDERLVIYPVEVS